MKINYDYIWGFNLVMNAWLTPTFWARYNAGDTHLSTYVYVVLSPIMLILSIAYFRYRKEFR